MIKGYTDDDVLDMIANRSSKIILWADLLLGLRHR
jgi:hypothetical protein